MALGNIKISTLLKKQAEKQIFIIQKWPLRTPSYERRLLDKANKIQGHFSLETWNEKEYQDDLKVSNTKISIIRKALQMAIDGSDLNEINDYLKRNKDRQHKTFADMLSYTKLYTDRVQKYMTLPEIHSAADNDDDLSLVGTKWFAYFLYYRNDDLYATSPEHREALIGRAVVIVKNEDGHRVVDFLNTGLDSIDYEGRIKPHISYDGGVIIFDLEAPGEKKRNLHIKLYCQSEDQPIMTGSYVTFELNNIQSGNILFQRVKDDITKSDTGCFSIIKNHAEYSKSDVIDPAIIEFLMPKDRNYQRVYKGVRDISGLKESLQSDLNFYYRVSRFLEKPVPEIYIAAPMSASSGYDEHFITQKICELSNKLGEANIPLKIVFDKYNENWIADRNKPSPAQNLKDLKNKRFFILFLQEVEKFSYSFIQFGIAINCCKFAVLVFKENSISKSLDRFEDNVLFKKVPYETSIELDWDKVILPKLMHFIEKNTPKFS